jgi:peptide/nickel transport system permease protein
MLQYIFRRILVVIPTLIMVSIISFATIALPPGDYMDSIVAQLAASGGATDKDVLDSMRKQYGLDQPAYVQYWKWITNIVLHGNFGQSFQWGKPVTEVIGDRMWLTVAISLITLLFTWAMAIPIGIYSATHQYSFFDHFFTSFGFIGIATPNFLLALILIYVAFAWFNTGVSGLFSTAYATAPWSWGKVVDFFKHVWVAIVVIGMGGTAGLIRVMRANLLDELHKPYVITARAKGLTETRLLMKYPVRVAINPFVSTIGWTLPQLFSGTTIVAIVLGLPIAGPIFLQALMQQDMYLAGSFVLILSVLTVIGTLISDILLAWVDPRIRLEAKQQ